MEWVQARGGSGGPEALGGFDPLWLAWVIPLLLLVGLIRLGLDAMDRSMRGGPPRSRRQSGGWRPTVRQPAPPSDVVVSLREVARPVPDRLDRGAEQLRAVEEAGYERKPLLNRGEARLLGWLDRAAKAAGQAHRVMAQVALNEVIRPTKDAPEEALGAIVAKRLDFAIVDRAGMVACAVEFHGRGHWGNHAAMRDAVKREALRKAGVRLVEVHHDATEKWVLTTVADLLGAPVCSPGNTSGIEQPAPR
jgi:hypothetical protein